MRFISGNHSVCDSSERETDCIMSVDDVQGKKNLPQSENNHLTLRDETETVQAQTIDNENINIMQNQFGCVYCIIIIVLFANPFVPKHH